jgi:hypothetical protein
MLLDSVPSAFGKDVEGKHRKDQNGDENDRQVRGAKAHGDPELVFGALSTDVNDCKQVDDQGDTWSNSQHERGEQRKAAALEYGQAVFDCGEASYRKTETIAQDDAQQKEARQEHEGEADPRGGSCIKKRQPQIFPGGTAHRVWPVECIEPAG